MEYNVNFFQVTSLFCKNFNVVYLYKPPTVRNKLLKFIMKKKKFIMKRKFIGHFGFNSSQQIKNLFFLLNMLKS